jgi:hypothetical protein
MQVISRVGVGVLGFGLFGVSTFGCGCELSCFRVPNPLWSPQWEGVDPQAQGKSQEREGKVSKLNIGKSRKSLTKLSTSMTKPLSLNLQVTLSHCPQHSATHDIFWKCLSYSSSRTSDRSSHHFSTCWSWNQYRFPSAIFRVCVLFFFFSWL